MQPSLTLTWAFWRMQANQNKKASLLVKVLVVFLMFFLLYVLCRLGWTFMSMSRADEVAPVFMGVGFCSYVLLLVLYSASQKKFKPVLIFPVNPTQLVFSNVFSDMASGGTLFFLGGYLWVGLCISNHVSEFVLYLLLFPLALFMTSAATTLGFFLSLARQSSKSWRHVTDGLVTFISITGTSMPFIPFYRLLSPLQFMSPLESTLSSLDSAGTKMMMALLYFGKFGKLVLPYLPTTFFASLFEALREGNGLSALYNFSLIFLFVLACFFLSVYVLEHALKKEKETSPQGEYVFKKNPLSEKLMNFLSVSPQIKGILFHAYLRASTLKWTGKEKKAALAAIFPIGVYAVLFLFAIQKLFYVFLSEFMIRIPYLPLVLTGYFLTEFIRRLHFNYANFLGCEGKALTTLLTFPIDRSLWLLQLRKVNIFSAAINGFAMGLFAGYFFMSFKGILIAFLVVFPASLALSGSGAVFSVMLPTPPFKGKLMAQSISPRRAMASVNPFFVIFFLVFLFVPFFILLLFLGNVPLYMQVTAFVIYVLWAFAFHQGSFYLGRCAFTVKEQEILENWNP